MSNIIKAFPLASPWMFSVKSTDVTDTTSERGLLGEVHGDEVSGGEEIWVNAPEECSVPSLTAPPLH